MVARAPTKRSLVAKTGTRRGVSTLLSVADDSQQQRCCDAKRRIRDRPERYTSTNNSSSKNNSTNRRSFHASSSIGFKRSWGPGDTDNDETDGGKKTINDMDPDDPDDVPDFLDDDDLLYNQQQGDNDRYFDDGEEERERYRLQQETVNDELDSRKGRPWTDPWEIKEEQWFSTDTNSENLPDWSPNFVSRISLEKLQVLPNQDGGGIPTLQEIAELSLPISDPLLHPARKTKTYAAFRKSHNYKEVKACVEKLAKDRVAALLKKAAEASKGGNTTDDGDEHWTDLQDSVDALFETLQEEAKTDPPMDILSLHPSFPSWVDRGLEEVLRDAENEAAAAVGSEDKPKETSTTETTPANETNNTSDSTQEFLAETPVFMDCYDPSEASPDGSSPGPMVPKILHPLAPHRHGGPGKMVEEWELSAHSTTKRIMLRECTQKAAKILCNSDNNEDSSAKIFVHGKHGVGKSTLLASIVATARTSGHIVMYLPDGDRLRKNGFYITPSTHPDRGGMFELPNLSLEVLQQLVESHDAAEQMEGMVADRATLELYFKKSQFKKLDDYRKGLTTSDDGDDDDGSISLLDLIEYAQGYMKDAPMVYSVVVNRLMHQTEKKFMIVMDEFNCLYDSGHYYHMAYDEDVKDPIPYDKISLFEPIMEAMNLSTKTVEEEEDSEENSKTTSTFSTSNVSVVVSTSESHAIKQSITSLLTECAERRTTVETIEVPPFSSLEADHVLANFEATGVGKLRLDRGDTLMNPQEMEYLKMVSGSIGQKLLDVSIL